MQTPLLLIIPCYNEALRLPVPQFSEFIQSKPNYDFCFVNDGSTDETQQILNDLSEKNANIFTLECSQNLGKAEAIRFAVQKMLAQKNYEFVGYWDADLSTPLNAIEDYLNVFEKYPQLSVVIGSRVNLLGRHVQRKFYRHYLGRVFATFASMILRIPVYDTQCGAKIIKTDLAKIIFADAFVTSWFFDVELMARIILWKGSNKAKNEIYELVLTQWKDIDGSKLKIIDFFKAPYFLFKIFIYMKKNLQQKTLP